MIYGNDISKHQRIDTVVQLDKGGKAEFIIMRSSLGTYTEDIHFSRFIKDSEQLGFKNSVYHASYAGSVAEAVQEADFCIDTLEKYGADVEMPIFFDYEYFSANYNAERGIATTPEFVRTLTIAFCDRVNERGYSAGVYLNKDYWDRFYGQAFFDKNPHLLIWYARPGLSKPDRECYLWQYASNNGADFGYTGGNIDKNILFGDYIEGEIEPMKPLCEDPIRMYIGYASSGDVKKLCTKINGLGIATEVKDGYITTGLMSRGDQCYVMMDCNALGIPYKIYEEAPVVECAECKKLKEELETANNKLLTVTSELMVANNSLAAEKAINSSYSKENAKLTETLGKIKDLLSI